MSSGVQQRVRATHARTALQLASSSHAAISQEQLLQLQSTRALQNPSVPRRALHCGIAVASLHAPADPPVPVPPLPSDPPVPPLPLDAPVPAVPPGPRPPRPADAAVPPFPPVPLAASGSLSSDCTTRPEQEAPRTTLKSTINSRPAIGTPVTRKTNK